MVEVCWDCDIADCIHIRERRAADAVSAEYAHMAYSLERAKSRIAELEAKMAARGAEECGE